MSILMTGGGTGGHLAIIKAVKEHLKEEELIYIGSTKGQDKQWFEKDKDFTHTYFFETRGVVNQGGLGKIKSLLMMTGAMFKSMKLIRKHKAKVVFSVGGFSAAPMAFAAKITRTPLVIHEQNAALGSLNKLLKPYATYFISSYLDESPIKAYPIKEIFFKNAHIRKELKTIIFLGGSQGARAINNFALSVAPYLNDKGIKIIHQTGKNEFEKVEQAYKELKIYPTLFAFDDNLAKHIGKSDFAVSRSGAGTLWELTANAIPTLFVPYPYAMDDHQYYNAKFLADKNLCFLVREDELSQEVLENALNSNIKKMSLGLEKQTFLKGGRLIVDEIMDL